MCILFDQVLKKYKCTSIEIMEHNTNHVSPYTTKGI